MEKMALREKLILVLEDMNQKAAEMKMQGVAVAACLPEGSRVDWIGEMKVVEVPYMREAGDHGWNLVGIAWGKVAEVIASEADSGNPDRELMCGEYGFVGGAYDEYQGCRLAFSFSGDTSENDLLVAQYGIARMKELLEKGKA